MRLLRLSKKIAQPKILGNNCELDLSWASGPGFKGGPENYSSMKYQSAISPFCRVRHIGSKVPGHIRSSRRCCIEQENNHIPAFLFGHHGEKQGASRPVGIVGTAGKNDQDTIVH